MVLIENKRKIIVPGTRIAITNRIYQFKGIEDIYSINKSTIDVIYLSLLRLYLNYLK